MVNKKHDTHEDIEVTDESIVDTEIDLETMDERKEDKIKSLREKISQLEDDKKDAQNQLQLAKADFLNARKRIDEDRAFDKIRNARLSVEKLLPLCDSFQMAMNDKEGWSKADESWRKGVEGIYTQLQHILSSYGVTALSPVGEPFDPHKHEAIGTESVNSDDRVDTVVSVVQPGYEITVNEAAHLIRPARVTTGIIA